MPVYSGRRLLRHESGGTGDPQAVAAAAELVFARLREAFGELIGAVGIGALYGHALRRAQLSVPLLEGVEARSDGTLTGLTKALGSGTAPEAEAAGAAVIDHFLALLVSLMGEDVGLRPVRRQWPELNLEVDFDGGSDST